MNEVTDIGEDVAAAQGSAAPSRRDLLIGGMLAAAAGLAWWREPHLSAASIGKNGLDKLVPTTIGPWRYQTASGIVLPPPDALAKLLYDQQLARTYVADNDQPVMLVMAYGAGQNGALQVHRPEICYPASGYRLTFTERDTLPIGHGQSIPVRTFTAESDTRIEQILYWSRIADHLPTSWTSQRIAIMEENLRGYIPDGLLVRVSTISPDRVGSMAVLERFCRTLLGAIGPDSRHKLIGKDYG
jgi:EpsI family protein